MCLIFVIYLDMFDLTAVVMANVTRSGKFLINNHTQKFVSD